MARNFQIPSFYRSAFVTQIKRGRREDDRTKRDLSPSIVNAGPIEFKLARHFGFCFGVENAIEIAYRALEENPGKRVFLLSEMIHNPRVNEDLLGRGVQFLQSTTGKELLPFETLNSDDVVIVPAFGTTVELFERLASRGIDPQTYNATCPFVERVWKRGKDLAQKGYTLIIHGKHDHEETRATFSHTCAGHAGLVVRDMEQATLLADFIRGKRSKEQFLADFSELTTDDFDPDLHLERIGVINQTTMLATETQEISRLLQEAMTERFGEDVDNFHFADTRDTLCYATTENQQAIRGLIESGGDMAIVVGGYNSSNTSHLVELLEPHMPTYYVKDANELLDATRIRHLNLHTGAVEETHNWIPEVQPLRILISAGASCPDASVEEVMQRVSELAGVSDELAGALQQVIQ